MNASSKKRSLGQFFTKNDFWLKGHILDFIKSTRATVALDPFAGDGDLLRASRSIGFKKIIGMDIDHSLGWKHNDSLVRVPVMRNSIIITNPPYLTNYSAKRKGLYLGVKKYFESCRYDDLYQLAMDKCLANEFGVMIVPETFINSSFPKNRLVSITIIESKLFNDTDNPICVVCFDGKIKPLDQVKFYKNDKFLGTLGHFEKLRRIPHKGIFIRFNAPRGKIALRAVDTTNPQKPISFMRPEEIDYDLNSIKESSRLITLIDLRIDNDEIGKVIEHSNEQLAAFRNRTHDVLLSPFKGNKTNGERRRRLDYFTARAFLEDACEAVCPNRRLGLS
jgi:hypothetical protein